MRATAAYWVLMRWDVENVSTWAFWMLFRWALPRIEAQRAERRRLKMAFFGWPSTRTTAAAYGRRGGWCGND